MLQVSSTKTLLLEEPVLIVVPREGGHINNRVAVNVSILFPHR